ncbi:MAG: glycosyltransferase, partial [Alphaproteobacteria bacterium]
RDPAPWLAHADLFVLASRWEGFGHVIVEAMACGAPVLATDCPYGPKDIVREGENGILVASGRAATLASAMARILHDSALRRRLAEAGRERARAFEAARIAADYADLFEKTARLGANG